MSIHKDTMPVLSIQEEEIIVKIQDLLEKGRSRKASGMLLEFKEKFFISLKDYRSMFQYMRLLKKNGSDLTFSFLHKCGDKTVLRFIKDFKKATTTREMECIFFTSEGGCKCPRGQDERIKNTDLFVHYLEALYEHCEENKVAA